MSAALVGISAVQVYWIKWSLELDAKKFDERVFSVLKTVSDYIESYDLDRQEKTKILTDPGDYSIFNEKKDFRFSLSDTSLGKLNDDAMTWQRLKFQYEMLDRQRRINPPAMEERIPAPQVLARFLKQQLEDLGIKLGYNYGIFDNETESFIIINDKYSVTFGSDLRASVEDVNTSLGSSKYHVVLFPADPDGSPGQLFIHFPNKRSWLYESVWEIIAISGLMVMLILFCFSYTIYVIFRQKKISEIKNDFINNMTHEFKTPIATISLASDSITNPMVLNDPEKVSRFAGIIQQENKRMLNQVEKVLQMALIDKREFDLNISKVNLHELIQNAVQNFTLHVEQRGGSIKLDLNAENPNIYGDSTHISNMIHNLLDNANKYSPEKPEITVSTYNTSSGLKLIVSDKGVGLSKEAKRHIFERFYRVHTGNIHDVKGFGLGLSYIKTMITAHNGSVDVKSELGKGSSFILYFPFNQPSLG